MHHNLIVRRENPKIVVVAVRRGDLAEVMPAVGRFPKVQVVDINRIGVLRVSR